MLGVLEYLVTLSLGVNVLPNLLSYLESNCCCALINVIPNFPSYLIQVTFVLLVFFNFILSTLIHNYIVTWKRLY